MQPAWRSNKEKEKVVLTHDTISPGQNGHSHKIWAHIEYDAYRLSIVSEEILYCIEICNSVC